MPITLPGGLIERPGSLSAMGVAPEAVFGTPVTPTGMEPFKTQSLAPDIGVFYPPLITGFREANVFPLRGQAKYMGSVGGALFPVNGVPLLVATIGGDGGRKLATGVPTGFGVTGAVPGSNLKAGTLTGSGGGGALAINDASVIYTLVSGAAPATNDFLAIDTNSSSTTSEVRKITAVSGAGPYTLTLDSGVNWTHAAAVTANRVVAPFSHSVMPTNMNDSLTLEKLVGGHQSQQFFGCRVGKMGMKLGATNTEAEATFDVSGMGVNVLDTPSSETLDTALPFVFQEATLNVFGNAVQIASAIEFTYDNATKENWTMGAGYGPTFITPQARKVTGKLTLVYLSHDDSTYGYFAKYNSFTGGALSLALAHPDGTGVTFTFPNVNLTKYSDDLKLDDIVMVNLEFTANLALGATPPNSMSALVKNNSVYLPY